MKKTYSLQELQKKFENIYIDVYRFLDWKSGEARFEVRRTSKTIAENMTLGQDVGTPLAYTR